MSLESRIRRFLVPKFDHPADENVSIADDRLDGRFAFEHLFERMTVGVERVEVVTLGIGTGGEELGDAEGDVL